jgi:hypothetical protein
MLQRFGVICDDPRAAPLLKALVSRTNPVALCAVRLSAAADELFHGLRGVEFVPQWEDLLPDATISDVLVGGASDEALRAARHLAQAGKTVWLLPHPGQGLLFAYEIGLQLEEGQGVVAPVFPDRALTWWQQLVALAGEGGLRGIQYIEIERFADAHGESAALSEAVVDARLLWDLDLVRRLAGRYSRVTTLRTGGDGGHIRQQTVTLTGEGVPETVWTIKPRAADSADRLTLHTTEGTWQLEVRDGGATQWLAPPPSALLDAPLRSDADVLFPTDVTAAAWRAAIEAFELADAVQHSLERRRTIELHHEPVSERTIFKTQMTALGCGVLAATLLLTVGYVAVDSMIPLGRTARIILWTVICTPLVLYLAAQFLLPLSRPSRR